MWLYVFSREVHTRPFISLKKNGRFLSLILVLILIFFSMRVIVEKDMKVTFQSFLANNLIHFLKIPNASIAGDEWRMDYTSIAYLREERFIYKNKLQKQ